MIQKSVTQLNSDGSINLVCGVKETFRKKRRLSIGAFSVELINDFDPIVIGMCSDRTFFL